MRASAFKRYYNEMQILNIIWNLSLASQNIFSQIHKEADFLKSEQSLTSYLYNLRDKNLIKKIKGKWLLTIKGHKTLSKIQKPKPLENILVPLAEGSITVQEAIELKILSP